MIFKRVWAYYSNEEAVESAKRLEAAGISCRISQREKGLFGDPTQTALVWLSVAESDYLLGVDIEGADAGDTYWPQSGGSAPDKAALNQEQDSTSEPPWTCQQCGEHLEAQFASCWNCGTNRPKANEGAG